jgi:hypothetical protein
MPAITGHSPATTGREILSELHEAVAANLMYFFPILMLDATLMPAQRMMQMSMRFGPE